MLNIEKHIETVIDMCIAYGPKILLAIVVLLVGLRLITFFLKMTDKGFEKGKVDKALRPFINTLLGWGLRILLLISVASMIGIETTSFIAVLGAVGLAIGMSLQGTLSNFAGGVLLLMLRPYRVGDWIDIQGTFGGVEEIGIFHTTLITIDNQTVIIPNGIIMNDKIANVSTKPHIRVDLNVSVSYQSDLKQSRAVLMKVMSEDTLVLEEPAPQVAVDKLADSGVGLIVMPYCRPENYWSVRYGILEKSKLALDEAGIQIPFPQLDVHVKEK